MNELVSIIMPSYNTGKYIAESIQSIIEQTYKNWELLIIDDCSTDNTDDVVSQFRDLRIRYLKNDKNSGAAVSRNYGLQEAKGKWIAFLDSDDLWMPQKIEKQISFMQKNHYFFSYTQYEEIDEQSKSLGRVISGPKRITQKLMKAYCWPGCLTIMYDAEKIGMIQIENLQKHNDYAMWLKAIKNSDCYLLEQNLARYRKRNGSISNTGYSKLIKYHYLLWKNGEKCSSVIATVRTIENVFCGVWKKLAYVKKEDGCR